jgi:hypothetical protein
MKRTKDEQTDTDAREEPALLALGYREAFADQVSVEDVAAIAGALVERAKDGDLAAARIILDRVLGSGPMADWASRSQVELLARFG